MKRLKNKAVPSKNTTRKKNNGGMTYVELLVALSLLVLIVTMFSPMLLSSYDRIYRAGEITSDAFDSRFAIEDGLASREDHTILPLTTNFKVLTNTINVKMRQVISATSNLETLYSGGKGVIKIVSDTLVKDNQSAHNVRLRLTNLDFGSSASNYTVLNSVQDFEAIKADPSKIEGKVAFYITSVFDTTKPLKAKVVNTPVFVTGETYFPFVDILIEDIDITYSPIQFSAYYINDFGTMKVAKTYLTITEADIIFVGETKENAEYFTFSDAGTIENPVIAGRVMYTAPIGAGKTLTDVSYNPATATLTEGFYAMCGENGIARRLWHLDATTLAQVKALDSNAVDETATSLVTGSKIIYKAVTLGGGTPYFQYDWAGDLNDLLAFTSSTNSSSVIDYGTSSTADQDFGNGDYVWKNEYNVDENYYAYNFDGFNANHGSFKDNHRRISYVLETTEANLKSKYGVEPQDGYYMRKYQESDSDLWHNGVEDLKAKRYIYNVSDQKWYVFTYSGSNYKEFTYKSYGLVSGLMNNENMLISEGVFFGRDYVAEGSRWGSNERAIETDQDYKLACVVLKSYNTLSPGALVSNGLTDAESNKTQAKVDFTSCSALPGTIESFYLGTLDSYGIINETKSVTVAPGNSGLDKDDVDDQERVESGLISSFVLIQDGTTTYLNYYDQKAGFDIGKTMENGGRLNVSPNIAYGRNQYQSAYNSNSEVHKTWGMQDSNARFTMGYCSDLYAMYESLEVRDLKPLEEVYMGSYNAADNGDTDGDFRKNLWFPREFLNITDSATYGNSMVAVGYDVGGTSKLYYEYSPEFTTSTDTKFLYGERDVDTNNDGTIDCFEPGAATLTKDTIGNYKGLFWSQKGGDYYIVDVNPGNSSEGAETYISLPKHISTSTVVDGICNNGVISVYNPATECFVHVGYIKGSSTNHIRLNCVSMDMAFRDEAAGTGVLAAAIGGSDGKVYLALFGYDANGMIGEAPLVWNQTLFEIANYSQSFPNITDSKGFSSIESIKAFKHGDDFCILVGGRSKGATEGTYISLITIEDCDLGKVNHKVETLVSGLAYDITDIIIAEDYIYATAHDYNKTHGAIAYCPLTNSDGVVDVSLKNQDGTQRWTFIGDYYTEFTTDKETGTIKTSGSSTALPPLKALASTMTSIS